MLYKYFIPHNSKLNKFQYKYGTCHTIFFFLFFCTEESKRNEKKNTNRKKNDRKIVYILFFRSNLSFYFGACLVYFGLCEAHRTGQRDFEGDGSVCSLSKRYSLVLSPPHLCHFFGIFLVFLSFLLLRSFPSILGI